MAFGAGKSGKLQIDTTSGGSLGDVSSYVTNVSWSASVDLGDTSTLSAVSRSRIKLLNDANFSIDFLADPTFIDMLEAHYGASVSTSYEYSPMGTTAGMPKYTGEAFISDISFTTSVDGVVSGSASFVGSGVATLGQH